MQLKTNQEIYAGWDIENARNFCKINHFDKEKVKILGREGQIIIIARKEFLWEKKPI